MTGRKHQRLPGISCPHCGARSIVRSSEQVTPIVRELRLNCDNDDCGHSFVAMISVIRTIRPSMKPNPQVHLPVSDRKRSAANEDPPIPANDERAPAEGGSAPMSG